ncbi:hypothetical protein BD779DRAFT_1443531, partial [Infundibulicybe gibba]
GHMAQVGWNAGPRHCVVSGLAKSFSKSLSPEEYISRDQDAIALVTLFWSLARVTIPMEVISIIDKCLEDNNLPEISGRHAPQAIEPGYRLSIGGRACYFPQFPRGPPEAYFTSNYQAYEAQITSPNLYHPLPFYLALHTLTVPLLHGLCPGALPALMR